MRFRRYLNGGVLAVALLLVLPMIAISERFSPGSGRRLACRAIRAVGLICGLRFESRGADRMDESAGYILVPNHSGYLDIPAMLLADESVRFLAASGLFRVPLLSAAMRALGTEPIDRRNRQTAYRQLSELAGRRAPKRLVVFAQGGIARGGEKLRFRNGAFVLALETATPVVPVAIHASGELLPPSAKLAVRPGVVTVEFLEPIATAGMTAGDRDELRDRVNALVEGRLESGPPVP